MMAGKQVRPGGNQGDAGGKNLRSARFWIREHPLAALCACAALLLLANVAREVVGGIGGGLLWFVLFVPSVMVGGVLLRVFWERRRDR